MTGEATDLVALKRLAEEATPGPWEPVSLSGYGSPFSIRMAYQSDNPNASKTHYGIQSVRTRGDAHFIAAANHATIKALIAELREARGLLKPFAVYYEINDLDERLADDAIEVPVGDLRLARAFLARNGKGEG